MKIGELAARAATPRRHLIACSSSVSPATWISLSAILRWASFFQRGPTGEISRQTLEEEFASSVSAPTSAVLLVVSSRTSVPAVV
jgi:hypothetical protein